MGNDEVDTHQDRPSPRSGRRCGAIRIGSPSTANLTASLFEAYMETDKTVEIVLEHQSGSNPEQIYLRVFTQNSPWHAMARISIRTT